MVETPFRFVFGDALDQLRPDHWDAVVAQAGRFLSRRYLRLIEQHRPEGLTLHYALVFSGATPVAAVVAQSLDIRVADLSGHLLHVPEAGFWRGVGEASQRSLDRASNQLLLYDSLLLWPFHDVARPPDAEAELWPEVVWDLGKRFRQMMQDAGHLGESWFESSVAWVHMRFLVCGSLLSTGAHGVAFAKGYDPTGLWPGVLEALERIRKSGSSLGPADMVMLKDLSEAPPALVTTLLDGGYHRFETEPNMVLTLRPTWGGFEDCVRDMKSRYRTEIRGIQGELDQAGLALKRLAPAEVEAEAGDVLALYHQVHDRQKLRLTSITRDWIPALAHSYRDEFRVMGIRPVGGGRLLGFVTVLRDGDSAVGQWIGFDKTMAAKGLPLYRSLIHAGVDQALEMGVSRLVLGRTALGAKAQIGAKPEPMHGYLRHARSAMNLAVPTVLALLPSPQAAPARHPFRDVSAE